MQKLEKTAKISGIVFNGIWMLIAIVCWFGGRILYTRDPGFTGWLSWGVFCVLPIIVPMIRWVAQSAKDGARDGANSYTATDYGNSIRVSNHPIRGAIIGTLSGIFVGLLSGPIALPIFFLNTVVKTIKSIVNVAKSV